MDGILKDNRSFVIYFMQNKLQINFFYVLLIGVAILLLFIFLPFFQSLFLGAMLSIISYPFYLKMVKPCFGSKNLAAGITTALLFFIIIIPVGILLYFLIGEGRDFYNYFANGGGSVALMDYVGRGQILLNRILPDNLVPETTLGDIQNYLNSIYGWAGSHFTSIFSNAISFLINLFIFLLSVFFFLRDGKKFKDLLVKLSPLNNAHDEKLLHTMALSVRSVVKGSLFVSIVQGLLTSIGFWIFGLQSPVLWGLITMVAALLPGIGAFFVIIPTAIYLYFSAGIWFAVGFFLWGSMVVIVTDNFLRPLLLERGIKIHPFLILLSVFGGFGLFGALGFLIGPIILSLFFALMEIHPEVISVNK